MTCSREPSTTSCPCCRRRGGTPSRSRCSSRSRTTAPSIRARSRSRPGARSRRWPSGRRCSSRSTTSSGSTRRRSVRSRSHCEGSTARARCSSCSQGAPQRGAAVGARAFARPGARPTARRRAARRRRAPPVPPRPARPCLCPSDAAAHPRAVGRESVLRPRAGARRRPRRRPDAAASGSRDAGGGRPAAARGASLVDPQRARAPLGVGLDVAGPARARGDRCGRARAGVCPRRCSSGTRGSSGSRTRCWPPSCTAAWATSGWRVHARLAGLVDEPLLRARHLALSRETPNAGVASALDAALSLAAGRGASAVAAELAEHALRLTPPETATSDRRRALAAARPSAPRANGRGRARSPSTAGRGGAQPGARRCARAAGRARERRACRPAARGGAAGGGLAAGAPVGDPLPAGVGDAFPQGVRACARARAHRARARRRARRRPAPRARRGGTGDPRLDRRRRRHAGAAVAGGRPRDGARRRAAGAGGDVRGRRAPSCRPSLGRGAVAARARVSRVA